MKKKIEWGVTRCSDLYFDNSRTNSHYYVNIDLSAQVPGSWKSLERSLEITLNGPGLSKANKKIRRELLTRKISPRGAYVQRVEEKHNSAKYAREAKASRGPNYNTFW